MNKGFITLAAIVLVLGVSLGGAFAGGIAVGKSGGDSEVQPTTSLQSPDTGLQPSGQFGGAQGGPGPFRQRPGGQGPDRFGAGGLQGGGLFGTVEQIEGNQITVSTAQGELRAIITAETVIQTLTEGLISDLESGMRVTIVGQRSEDGSIMAGSILIIPGDTPGFFGRGPTEERQRQPGQLP